MCPVIRAASVAAYLAAALACAGAPAFAQAGGAQDRMAPMHGAAGSTYKLGALVITAPWIRATPKGAPVAGGYLKITNNGTEPDRLVGGSLAAAGGFEVHDMTMDGGVMKMRPIPGGLEIKPGQTVELSPGGEHIMFLGLKEQLKQGETVKGSLEFAKAGRLDITYQVGAMGGGAPGMDMHHR